jgi:hypothetical protein
MTVRIRISVAFIFAVLEALLSFNSAAQGNRLSKIDLHRTFGPRYACRLYERPIQFFSETELVLMSGPTEDCYRSVDQLELNLISIDGHILSHKHWPSTYPGVVIAPGRLVLEVPDGLQVVNRDLTAIESVVLPHYRGMPFLGTEREGIAQEGTVSVQTAGHELMYGGEPLKLLKETEVAAASEAQLIFRFADGRQLMKDGDSLIEVKTSSQSRTVAALSWAIPPCKKNEYCQAYGAGVHFQVSTGNKRRILVFSNGSQFPVTDAAGLFPYFRLQVFDLDTGAELCREEDSFRTGDRSASVSPDGDLLAVFDGKTIIVYRFP